MSSLLNHLFNIVMILVRIQNDKRKIIPYNLLKVLIFLAFLVTSVRNRKYLFYSLIYYGIIMYIYLPFLCEFVKTLFEYLNALREILNTLCIFLNAWCEFLNALYEFLNAVCELLNTLCELLNAMCEFLKALCVEVPV